MQAAELLCAFLLFAASGAVSAKECGGDAHCAEDADMTTLLQSKSQLATNVDEDEGQDAEGLGSDQDAGEGEGEGEDEGEGEGKPPVRTSCKLWSRAWLLGITAPGPVRNAKRAAQGSPKARRPLQHRGRPPVLPALSIASICQVLIRLSVVIRMAFLMAK